MMRIVNAKPRTARQRLVALLDDLVLYAVAAAIAVGMGWEMARALLVD